jgi:hypothetical protein
VSQQRLNKAEHGRAVCVLQAKRARMTKKGDIGIRKSSDVYLPASHAGLKPILFIGGRDVA